MAVVLCVHVVSVVYVCGVWCVVRHAKNVKKRVFGDMWTCCRYTVRRFESAHGGVLGSTHGGRESEREGRKRSGKQGQKQKTLKNRKIKKGKRLSTSNEDSPRVTT